MRVIKDCVCLLSEIEFGLCWDTLQICFIEHGHSSISKLSFFCKNHRHELLTNILPGGCNTSLAHDNAFQNVDTFAFEHD